MTKTIISTIKTTRRTWTTVTPTLNSTESNEKAYEVLKTQVENKIIDPDSYVHRKI